MTTTYAEKAARKAALMAKTGTAQLIVTALKLENAKGADERLAYTWALSELAKRAGLITPAEEPEFDRIVGATGSRIAALLHLRPALLRSYAASQPGYPDLPPVYDLPIHNPQV
jgi:hypothetical protein